MQHCIGIILIIPVKWNMINVTNVEKANCVLKLLQEKAVQNTVMIATSPLIKLKINRGKE